MEYTVAQLAYLAGILDGEGCFHICDKRPSPRKSRFIRELVTKKWNNRINFTTIVSIINCDARLMDYLTSMFGGRVYVAKRPLKPNWRPKCTWHMSLDGMVPLLTAVLPHLVLKKEQAELMIRARETFDANPKALKTSDEVYQLRFELASRIRHLNSRGVLPPCCPSA